MKVENTVSEEGPVTLAGLRAYLQAPRGPITQRILKRQAACFRPIHLVFSAKAVK